MRARRANVGFLALLLAATVSACGDVDRLEPDLAHATPVKSDAISPTVFPAPSESPEPTSSGTTSPSASASPTGGGGGNAVLASAANVFDPATLTVKVGSKVTWTIQGVHSVTGGKDGTADPGSPIGDSGIKTEGTYEVTFTKAGTFPYYCIPHVSLGMKGEIVVQ